MTRRTWAKVCGAVSTLLLLPFLTAAGLLVWIALFAGDRSLAGAAVLVCCGCGLAGFELERLAENLRRPRPTEQDEEEVTA